MHQSTTPFLSQTIWPRWAILQSPYSPDVGPCDFWLFPKLRGCRYETIEEIEESVTKVIDTLTQEDFHGAFQKLLETYKKGIAAGGDYFEGDESFMRVLSIKVPIRKSLETYRMPHVFRWLLTSYVDFFPVCLFWMSEFGSRPMLSMKYQSYSSLKFITHCQAVTDYLSMRLNGLADYWYSV